MHGVGTTVSFQHLQLWSGLAEDSFCLGSDSCDFNYGFGYPLNYGVCQMTTFKEAQRVQSQKAARSKRFNRVPTEDQEQMTLMSWAHRVKYGSGRLSDYLFHIPNGGSRNILEAAKFKKLGVKAGVPDLQLIVPNGEIHGLWIELKSKKGKLQPSQRLMIQRLEEQGYMCKVCFGADEAIDEIKSI